MLWVIRIVCVGGAAAVAYVLGERRGGRKVADQLREDPELGRRVLEELAPRCGARLEFFDVGGGGDGA